MLAVHDKYYSSLMFIIYNFKDFNNFNNFNNFDNFHNFHIFNDFNDFNNKKYILKLISKSRLLSVMMTSSTLPQDYFT